MSEKKATRVAYGEHLAKLGAENPKIVVLDADLAVTTNTAKFQAVCPERFFDCGIAEGNMMNIAAGLSTMGYIPFASTFAIFGSGRAYENIRNGVAYPKLNVKLAFTHAGISVGEDGGSHQSVEDIALMRVIPGMTVLVPADANETYNALDAAVTYQGPVYLRLSRLASAVLEEQPFEIGKANILRDGKDVALFCCGLMVEQCLEAAKLLESHGISAAVINVHTIKPLDEEIVRMENRPIADIFAQDGEDYFRGVETALLKLIADTGGYLVSCGGGVPMRQENVHLMKESGYTVLLTASPAEILSRVKDSEERPILNGHMNEAYIAELMEKRRPFYEAAADVVVCTDGRQVDDICREILQKLTEKEVQ